MNHNAFMLLFSITILIVQSPTVEGGYIGIVEEDHRHDHDNDEDRPPPPLPRPHPHAGARDRYGRWGYVANVTSLRSYMIQRSHCSDVDGNVSSDVPRHCSLPYQNEQEMDHVCHEDNITALVTSDTYEILRHRINRPYYHDNNDNDNHDDVKILCSIYTYDGHHDYIRGIAETWGWRCDGFLAASTKTTSLWNDANDDFIIDLPHEGNESYDNMWQKTRSIVSYLYDHYLNDYDYFYLCGDDTYVIVEHLRHFLRQQRKKNNNAAELLFTGLMIYLSEENVTKIDGGGGYILSREALRRLVEEAIPSCHVHTITTAEDWIMTECLASIGISIYDSSDHGLLRFHKYDLNHLTTDIWFQQTIHYYRKIYQLWRNPIWRVKDVSTIGQHIVSPTTIAFHNIKGPIAMKRHHVLYYHENDHHHYYPCPTNNSLGQLLINDHYYHHHHHHSSNSNSSSSDSSSSKNAYDNNDNDDRHRHDHHHHQYLRTSTTTTTTTTTIITGSQTKQQQQQHPIPIQIRHPGVYSLYP